MGEDMGFGIGCFPGLPGTGREDAKTKILDGLETACLEIIGRIEQEKGSGSNKELMDLSMALTGLATTWNMIDMRMGTTGWRATE